MTKDRVGLYRAALRSLLAWLPLALGLVAGTALNAPPAPGPADAPAEEFSSHRAFGVLERLLGDGSPHPVGSPENEAVRERLLAELESLGLEPEMQTGLACNLRFMVCGEVVNVVAPLRAVGDEPVVLLTAHYDSAAAAPGAADDMAGVAALLETARALRAGEPTENPVVLLFTDGEEAGLLGARAFLQHPLASQVGVVANLEARGSRGASLLFETSADNAWLIDAFAAEARRAVTSSLLYEVYRLLPNDTDLTEYRAAGMPGVNFAFAEGLPHYHTPLDDLANLSPASLQHHGENALAAARAFGAADLASPPSGGALFTYVAPGVVLRAPLGWTLPLALLGAALSVAAALLAQRRGRLTPASWSLGFVAALSTVVFAGLVATGIVSLLGGVRPEAEPWYAVPLPTRVAVWAAAFVAASLSTAAIARRAGRWGLSSGAWTLWAALTVAAAVLLPGASAELVLPLLVAGGLHLFAAWLGKARRGWSAVAVGGSAAAAAFFWLPLASAVESGMGLAFAGAVAVLVGLVATTAAPLLTPPDERFQRPEDLPAEPSGGQRRDRRTGAPPDRPRLAARLAASAAGAVALVALVVALTAPAYTELWPRRLSLVHLQEWDDGELEAARWLADAAPAGPLPGALAEAADWRPPVALLPYAGTRYAHAPAEPTGATPPQLEVVSDEERDGERVLALRLRTSAPPLRATVGLPADLGLAEARFVGTASGWDLRRAGGIRDRHVHCQGASCDGRVIELSLRGPAPHRLYVAEVTRGLPQSGARLTTARPSTAVPSHDGDVTVQVHFLTIP